jgi:glycosyltransferase involved in cell wall biosynthesis
VRILHLCSYSLYSGPIPATLGLALAQRQLGHTVYLGYDVKRGAFNDFEEAAAPWIEPHGLTPPLPLTLSAKSTAVEWLRDRTHVRRTLHGHAIDLIHVHLSHDHGLAALAGRPVGVPLVRTMHAERSLERRFGQAWLHRRVQGFILRCVPHQQLLCERFGVDPARTRVIEGSIDASRFAPASGEARRRARVGFDLPSDVPVLVHVALIAGRGQVELVRAMALLGRRAPHVLFVGRGEEEAELKRLVDEIGVGQRVRFTGYLQGDRLLEAYAAADAAFLAAPGNDAAMRAALEAMACGLPLLAVSAGALGELCTTETGFPISERAPAAIVAAVTSWLDAGDRARSLGRTARGLVERERTFAREATRTVAFYDELIRLQS